MTSSGSQIGVLIVDHGSRLPESNQLVEDLARQFQQLPGNENLLVEPAHMELAEPSIATAYGRLVVRGASIIIVLPYFLGPGKHWTTDIPVLVSAAASGYPQTRFRLAAPLGTDSLILQLLRKRLEEATSDA